jgi:hypothetical protein
VRKNEEIDDKNEHKRPGGKEQIGKKARAKETKGMGGLNGQRKAVLIYFHF